MGDSVSINEHYLSRIESEIKEVQDKINSISQEISTNKEKYMPAVALINELKIQMKNLIDDFHNAQLLLSKSDSVLQASTEASHKRLDKVDKVLESLEKLPATLRGDFFKLAGFVVILLISFGVWTENNIVKNQVRISILETRLNEVTQTVRENNLNIAKTYQTVKSIAGVK